MTGAPGRRRRGVWVWQRVDPQPLLAFVVSRRVDVLHLAVPVDADPAHRRWLRDVASAASGWGVALQALGGDPRWCDEPGEALAWQRAAQSLGVFERVHVDVEFWARPDWPTDPVGLAGRYLALLDRLGEHGPVQCDLAWWLHRHRTAEGEPLDEAVLRRVAAATLMTYRTRVTGTNGLLDIAAPTLAAGARTGTPVQVAVDTSPPRDGGADDTFHGRPAAELDRALGQVDAALSQHPSYAGVAVHDLAGWWALRAG